MPPPNTPEEGLTSAGASTRIHLFPPLPTVDLKALEYLDEVDENLVCPICRLPLVAPTITNCDHVFCQKCIAQAHRLNPTCPVDRLPLKLADETRSAPRIIHNQLGSLLVRCPNSSFGCTHVVARSLIEDHVTRYCGRTLVRCPHPACDKKVARKDSKKGCLHYAAECEYCEQVYAKVDLEDHQDRRCNNRMKRCELCETEFVRHRQDEHAKQCPEAETTCKYASLGCTLLMKRKRLDKHVQTCEYRVVGPIGDQMIELRAELKALRDKDQQKERRIGFLESKRFAMTTTNTAEGMADFTLPGTTAPADPAPYESRDQYFLSLFETMEAKVERLSSALNEVEGRQSVMLFSETLQLKDQITEIRSTLGVLGMHVRWLMNFRLQERGRVATSSPNISGSFIGTQDNNTDSDPPQQLAHTIREHPPRL
ncbi:hypothetical protein NUW58_g860 [Xylaria curta]|uniref:Uncharacterized protein n=1 Tax=Xylaria curta TaxID=42375 RepID=A0ACC1PMQ7_9PEZI|nr:hypothetical protein NUW58_g860 [Xylaria curta]